MLWSVVADPLARSNKLKGKLHNSNKVIKNLCIWAFSVLLLFTSVVFVSKLQNIYENNVWEIKIKILFQNRYIPIPPIYVLHCDFISSFSIIYANWDVERFSKYHGSAIHKSKLNQTEMYWLRYLKFDLSQSPWKHLNVAHWQFMTVLWDDSFCLNTKALLWLEIVCNSHQKRRDLLLTGLNKQILKQTQWRVRPRILSP